MGEVMNGEIISSKKRFRTNDCVRTLHAGLPVTSGNKVGMNIWTRQGVVPEELRGVDIED